MNEFKTNKLNDIKIEPVIKANASSGKNVRAYNMYKEPYANVALIARKKSGKSTVIYRSLEKCATKGTNVMIFASTINNDETYKKMIKMLEKKGCIVHGYDNFIQDGVNMIEQIIEVLSNPEALEEKVPDVPKSKICDFGDCPKKEPKKPKIQKKKDTLITPEWIFVFDDLSSAMRDRSVTRLLTKNRHYKCKIFLSMHSVNDLMPSALRMIDVFLVFPNISEDKIKEMADKVGLHFKNDSKKCSTLHKLYEYAGSRGAYNFLYIDPERFEFRVNFNEELEC